MAHYVPILYKIFNNNYTLIVEMSHFLTIFYKVVNYDNIIPTIMTHLDTMYYSCYNYDRLTVDVSTRAARGLIHGPVPLHFHSRPVPACPCSRPCNIGSGSPAPWSRLGPRCRVCRPLAFLMRPKAAPVRALSLAPPPMAFLRWARYMGHIMVH
jgi:hypothetical protein